jgi:uncharacterized membrane protein YadS
MVDFSPLFVFSVCGLAASVTALIIVLAKGGANRRKPALVVMLLFLISIFATLSLPLVDVVSRLSSGEGEDPGAQK